jgi:hypothetical protein
MNDNREKGGMQRRRALKMMLSGGIAMACAPAFGDENIIEGQLWELAKSLGRDRFATSVGGAYIRVHPVEARPEQLIGLLVQAVQERSRNSGSSVAADLEFVIRDDFRRNDVEIVNDWWLSRTEARLYALSYVVS